MGKNIVKGDAGTNIVRRKWNKNSDSRKIMEQKMVTKKIMNKKW